MLLEPQVKGIFFDFYQTIADIKTDERKDPLWEVLASWLRYRGAEVGPAKLRDGYFELVERSLTQSTEHHPDVDVQVVFSRLLERAGITPSPELAGAVAQLLRSLSIDRFQLYSESREVLETLAQRFRLALVSDSQILYLEPELRQTSLASLFEVVVSSSTLGYRKPDPRMFEQALSAMRLARGEVVYVGDSWERDIVGAQNAGIQGIWVCRSGDRGWQARSSPVEVIRDLRALLHPARSSS
jgi:putative hydrolase of the HAD superfamily